MSLRLTFSAWIAGTELVFDVTPKALKLWNGERVTVYVEKLGKRRTVPQNRLLWQTYKDTLLQFEEFSGHTTDDLHEAMKARFCPEKELILPGGEVQTFKSTKRLTVEEFSDYIEKVRAMFSQYGAVYEERI